MLGLFLSLFVLLGQTLAVAPGDESGECGVPDYPVNIKVLLDSWRYQTLLAGDDSETEAVWTTYNTMSNKNGVVSSSSCAVTIIVLITFLHSVDNGWWNV